MADKYLLCDITGPYSGIEYGKKGDKIIHLGTQNEFELVELNGERFHVRKENLSETPVEFEKTEAAPDTVANNKIVKPVPVSKPKAGIKKAAPINKQQSSLF
jgi:hypothetical protein